MEYNYWNKILLKWIQCTDFMPNLRNHIEQIDVDIFYTEYKKHITTVILPLDIIEFIKDYYPSFDLVLNDSGRLSCVDYIYIYTLLFHFSCVKKPEEKFHKICGNMSDLHQRSIASFFGILMEHEDLTKEVMRSAIAKIAHVSPIQCINMDSPSRIPTLRMSPATPKSALLDDKSREVLLLKAQLETESYEKSDLETLLRQSEEQINKLHRTQKKHLEELQFLRNELLVHNAENVSPNKITRKEQINNKIRKEILEKEETIIQLKTTIETLTDKQKELLEKLHLSEKQKSDLIEETRKLDQTVIDLKSDLTKKSELIALLQETNSDLQNFIRETRHNGQGSDSLNSSSDLLDLSFTRVLNTSNTSPENLGRFVIDVQLKEQQLENLSLSNEIVQVKSRLKLASSDLKEFMSKNFIIFDNTESSDDFVFNNINLLMEKFQGNIQNLNELQIEKSKLLNDNQTLSNEVKNTEILLEKSKDFFKNVTESFETKIKYLNEKLTAHEEMSQQEKLALNNTIKSLEGRIEELNTQTEALKSDKIKHEKSLSIFEKDLCEFKNKCNELKRFIITLEAQNHKYLNESQTLQASNDKLNAEIKEISIKKTKISITTNKLKTELHDIRTKFVTFQKDIENSLEKLKSAFNELVTENQNLKEKQIFISNEYIQFKEENAVSIKQTIDMLTEITNQKNQVDTENAIFIDRIIKLQQDLESVTFDFDQVRIQNVELENKNATLIEARSQLEKDLKENENLYSQTRVKSDELIETVNKLNEEKQLLTNEVNELKEIKLILEKDSIEQQKTIESISNQLNSQEILYKTLFTDFNALAQNKLELEIKHENISDKYNEINTELIKLKQDSIEKDFSSQTLSKTLIDLQNEKQELILQNQNTLTNIEELKNLIAELQIICSNNELQIKTLSEKNSEILLDCGKSKEVLDLNKNLIETLEHEQIKYLKINSSLNEKIELLSCQFEQLQKEKNCLEVKLEIQDKLLADMESKIKNMEEEKNKNLQIQIELQAKNNELNTEIEKLEQDLNEKELFSQNLSKSLIDLQQENQELIFKSQSNLSKVDELTKLTTELQVENSNKELEIKIISEKNSEISIECSETKEILDSNKRLIHDLEQEKLEFLNINSSLNQQKDLLTQNIEQLQNEKQSIEERDKVISGNKNDLNTELAKLKQESIEKDSSIQKLSERFTDLEKENQELILENKMVLEKVNELTNLIDELQIKYSKRELEIKTLSDKNSEMLLECYKSKEVLDSNKNLIQILVQEKNDSLNINSSLNGKTEFLKTDDEKNKTLDENKLEIGQLKEEITVFELQNNSLEEKLGEDNNKNMQIHIELQEKYNQMNTEIGKLEQYLNEKELLNQKLSENLADLQKENQELIFKNQIHLSKIDDLTQLSNEAQVEISNKELEMKIISESNSSILLECSKIKEMLDSNKSLIQDLEEENANLLIHNTKKLENEKQSAEEKFKNISDKYNDLNTELLKVKQDSIEKDLSIQKLTEELTDLQKQKRELLLENKMVLENVNELTNKIDQLQIENSNKDLQIKKYSEENSKILLELDSNKSLIQNLEREKMEYLRINSNLNEKIELLSSDFEKLENEKKILESRIDDENKKILKENSKLMTNILEIQQLKNKNACLEQQNKILEEKVSEDNSINSELKLEMETKYKNISNDYNELSTELTKLKQDLLEKDLSTQKLAETFADLQKEKQELMLENKTVSSKIDELTKFVNELQSEISNKESEIKTLSEKNSDILLECNKSKEILDSNKTLIQTLEEEKIESLKINSSLNEKIKLLSIDVEKIENEKHDLEGKVKLKSEKELLLSKQIIDLESRIQTVDDEKNKILVENSKLMENILENKQLKKDTGSTEMENMVKQNTQISVLNKKLNDHLKVLIKKDQTIEKLTNENLQIHKENEHLKVILKEREAINEERLAKDIAILKAKLYKNRQITEDKEKEWSLEKQQLNALIEEQKSADERIKENRLELVGKLEKMKDRMKTLYTDEMAKVKAKHETELQKISIESKEQNDKNEKTLEKLMKQIYQLNEKNLLLQKDNKFLQTKIDFMKSTTSISSSSRNLLQQQMLGSTNLKMEDEEGEIFNNTYLTDLKTGGKFSPTNYGRESIRLTELQHRNSLMPPHLRSTYVVQYGDQDLREEDIKDPMNINDSLSSLLYSQRKKVTGSTTYKRPGPPTPSKNAGRLSFGGGEMYPKECNETMPTCRNSIGSKKSSPNKFKSLFSSSKTKDELYGDWKEYTNDGSINLSKKNFLTSTPRRKLSLKYKICRQNVDHVDALHNHNSNLLNKLPNTSEWRKPGVMRDSDSCTTTTSEETYGSSNSVKNDSTLKRIRKSIGFKINRKSISTIFSKLSKSSFSKNSFYDNKQVKRDNFRYNSKQQRIESFNRARSSINNFNLRKSSLTFRDSLAPINSVSDLYKIIPQKLLTEINCSDDIENSASFKEFETLSKIKRSEAPFEVDKDLEFSSIDSVSTKLSNSKIIHSGSVIVNRVIPRISFKVGNLNTIHRHTSSIKNTDQKLNCSVILILKIIFVILMCVTIALLKIVYRQKI